MFRLEQISTTPPAASKIVISFRWSKSVTHSVVLKLLEPTKENACVNGMWQRVYTPLFDLYEFNVGAISLLLQSFIGLVGHLNQEKDVKGKEKDLF